MPLKDSQAKGRRGTSSFRSVSFHVGPPWRGELVSADCLGAPRASQDHAWH